jgi:hypothetical protein
MSRKGQRIPDEFQEGTYQKRRGRTVNTGKSYQPSSTHSAPDQQPLAEPPPVPFRHYGDQNDLDINSIDLDPTLPTQEEVRGSYGKVLNFTFKLYTAHCWIEPE